MKFETIESEYNTRINTLSQKVQELIAREKKVARFRFLIFVITITTFYILISSELEGPGIIFLIAGLSVLGYFMILSQKISKNRQFNQYLLSINEKEINCIRGKFQDFPNGKEYAEKEHAYTADLDIFGDASLFQYINRTTSAPGSRKLAEWLKSPASETIIHQRQEAIVELSKKLSWRQELMALGYKYKSAANTSEHILQWMEEPPIFKIKKYIVPSITILTLGLIIAIGASLLGASIGILTSMILVNYYFAGKELKNVNGIHRSVSKTIELLKSYSETIALIENEQFQSVKLQELQRLFKHDNYSASQQIQKLSGLVNKLDFRLNLLVALPLNLIFWDIRISLALETWKEKHQKHLALWFDCMAEFEALSSLGNLTCNNPDWVIPDIAPEHFQFKAFAMGHPLIPSTKRISNSLEIDHQGKLILITGSNMSGKSTFLRTCGVNIVLAMSGAPVCAKQFRVSRNTVFTSMRIIDSLEENTSSFYAELKRLAMIIQTVEKGDHVFLLLDEILRGTNSNDRHIGSVALIHQLLKNKATGIIATHDLDLSKLENELPGQLDNYNFDVKIENEELYFDYKLNTGICKSLNASILMRKMGIWI